MIPDQILFKDTIVRNKLDIIKQTDQKSIDTNLEFTDTIKKSILDIAQRFETILIDNNCQFSVKEICSKIVQLLENQGLESHIRYVYKILPDEYKDTKSQEYKTRESKLLYKRYVNNLDDIQLTGFGKLSNEDVKMLHRKSMSYIDIIDMEMDLRGISRDTGENNDQLQSLKDTEKSRFIKASIGQPLETLQSMIEKEGVTYEQAFNNMRESFEKLELTINKTKNLFCDEYVPVSSADCVVVSTSIDHVTELFKPFSDKKYRRDHYQLTEIVTTKLDQTSTKASKISRIPSAHHIDAKTGLPIYRSMTKEQIDSITYDEINFIRETFNRLLWWYKNLSEVNVKHGGRCREDRALDLHEPLSFHA